MKSFAAILVVLMFTGVELYGAERRQELARATQDPQAVYTTSGLLARTIVINPKVGGCSAENVSKTLQASLEGRDELVRDGFDRMFCGKSSLKLR
jgi:hypothetical protein